MPLHSARLNGVDAAFARANPNAIFHGENEDFAVANFAVCTRSATIHDGPDRGLDKLIIHRNLQLNLAQ